MTNEIDDV